MAPVARAGERARVDAVLHGSQMGRLLSERFGLSATNSHVLDAKYEPGVSCTVLHELGPDLITTVVSLDGDGPEDGRGVVLAPGTRAFRFPDDPALTGLAHAMDSGWLERHLPAALSRQKSAIAMP